MWCLEEYARDMAVVYVTRQSDLSAVIKFYEDTEEIFLDFETSGLDARIDVPWLLALKKRGSNIVHVVNCWDCDISVFKETLERCTLVGANISFDLKFLRAKGIRPRNVYDVITIGRLLTLGKNMGYKKNWDPIPVKNDLSTLAKRNLGFSMDKSFRKEFVMHPQLVRAFKSRGHGPLWREEIINYAATDVFVLEDIMETQQTEVDSLGMRSIAIIENRLIPVVMDMEWVGVYVDRDRWMQIVNKARLQMGMMRKEICEIFKGSAKQGLLFSDDYGCAYDINLESPPVVKQCFLDIGIKIDNADKKTLSQLFHPVAKKILAYRSQQKLFSTYGKKWIDKIHSVTGRIHTHLNPQGADSGRFASNDPNTQNVPDNRYNKYPKDDIRWLEEKKSKYNPVLPDLSYRHCFRAREGYSLIVADYSQVELRIGAEVSDDEAMKGIILAGGDLHSRTASIMFNVPIEECGKDSTYRKAGKTLNFAIFYGLGDLALAESLGYDVTSSEKIAKQSVAKARKIKQQYFRTFQGIHAYTLEAQDHPFTVGYSKTMLGRRRYYTLPDRERVPEKLANGIEASLRNQGKNCVDTQTEILTVDGWKHYNEISEGTIILTKNIDTGMLEWNPIKRVCVYDNYQDDMYYFEGKSFSAACNADHRWIVFNKSNGKNEFRKTKNLSLWGDHRIHKTGDYVNDKRNPNYTDDEMKLVGLVVTDGHYKYSTNKAKPNRVHIHQVKTGVSSGIDELTDSTGMLKLRNTRKDGCNEWKMNDEFSQKMFRDLPGKKLNYSFLMSLSGSQLISLYTGMMSGDGCINVPITKNDKGKRVFTCKDEESADMFQMLLVLIGKSGYKYFRSECGPNGCWFVNIHHRDKVQLSKKMLTIKSGTGETIWCPSVENESFIARRNGQVYVTGNTPIQGTSADMTKIAMVAIADDIFYNKIDCEIINCVHDEIVLECRTEIAEEMASQLKMRMIESGALMLKSVPVDVEVNISECWEKH